jgi:hypothetical protein
MHFGDDIGLKYFCITFKMKKVLVRKHGNSKLLFLCIGPFTNHVVDVMDHLDA